MHEKARTVHETVRRYPEKKMTLIIKKGNEKTYICTNFRCEQTVSPGNILDEEDNITVQKDVSNDCQCHAHDDTGTMK